MRRMRKSDGDEAREALGSLFGLLERLNLPCKILGVHPAWVQSEGFGAFHQGNVGRHASRLEVRDGLRFSRERGGFLKSFLELAFAASEGVELYCTC